MQSQFDFDRADQLGMIERWQPPVDRLQRVSVAAVKHVLRAIDSHGRGKSAWPSEATLARETGYSLATVKRAVKALESLSLIIKERKGSLTLNHYTIVWSELALRAMPERSVTMPERSVMVNERSVTMTQRSVMVSPKTTEKLKEATTTTEPEGVVVVLRTLAKGERAIRLARARGLTDEAICELYRLWRALPEDQRLRGTLFNWLAIEGSYRAPAPPQPTWAAGRSDGLSRSQVAAESLRMRIVRAGRAAGASQEAIERRLEACGV